jgi:putative nucleotidyltransferase with HDIG domain
MDLASFAMDAGKSRGRLYPEPPHPYRNDYARDRDRVIHSRAFRRLEAKTQVFTTRYSDHFRNRLTHTMEVAQIARTVAGALALNADLAEALALVHDIGHPPFGHAGELKLDELLRPHGDIFDHNLQALRIVEQFEQRYLDFPGLNLTFEVREGIVKHSRDYDAAQYPALSEYLLGQRPPLEAQLIDFVDEIAYNTADLDDGDEASRTYATPRAAWRGSARPWPRKTLCSRNSCWRVFTTIPQLCSIANVRWKHWPNFSIFTSRIPVQCPKLTPSWRNALPNIESCATTSPG